MRFHISTLGCPKNVVDSEGMQRLLLEAGYEQAPKPEAADVIILNTCGFIDVAKEESIDALVQAALLKRPGQALIAAGCLAQRYEADLQREIPEIDGVIGTRHWPEIVDFLRVNGYGLAVEKPLAPGPYPLTPSAYLKISDGCNAPCAFCVIPQIKGPYWSKPREQVLREACQLVAGGVKEIVLIAQDTTAYGSDRGEKDGLAELIVRLLHSVPELPWLRLMYAYPQHITPGLIETMARHRPVCHYLDLPLQHAHPDTLKRMARPHNVGRIRRLISDLREAMPDIALRTSFIVGYPGEIEEEFQTLLDFIEEMRFDRVGIFTYSQEEGTPAATMPEQVPRQVKEERHHRAMALQQRISLENNRKRAGKTLEVLVEGAQEPAGKRSASDHGSSLLVGRSFRDAPEVDGLVFVTGRARAGEIVPVLITKAMEYDLWGEVDDTQGASNPLGTPGLLAHRAFLDIH
ncbi:MAG: 30S ribosomal protein S12 methylthiotransferase RimO [Chloroflexi bacterium]|nr:30S ribosomal protein S12 methylthiotransferase RimO [Chloroflexota bacterium]